MQINNNIHIELILTQRCNFRCKYCYEKNQGYKNLDMTDEVVNKVILYTDSYLEKTSGLVYLDFWGGEPSLRPDIINFLCNKYINNPRIFFSIYSNGYNIDDIYDSIIKCNKIDKNKFPVQISFDYFTQDKRISETGENTYNKVLDTIKRLHKDDVNFHTKSTITFDNLDKIESIYDNFCNVMDELEKIGHVKKPSLILTIDTMAKQTDSEEIFNYKFEQFKIQLKNIVRKNIKKWRDFSWLHTSEKPLCGSGQVMFCVDIDGNIYNCHGSIFSKYKNDHKRGNILNFEKNSHLYQYFLDFQLKDIDEECKKCESRYCMRCNAHCYDTSTKNSYIEKWFDFSNRKNFCKIHKEISKYMIAYNKIINNNFN